MSKVSIAIIGTGGFLGKPVLDAIESELFAQNIHYPVKAVTRTAKPSTSKVEYVVAELADTEKVVELLKGTDVIIELVGVNPVVFSQLEKINASVRPKLYIPSQFGVDIDQVNRYAPGFLTIKTNHTQALRAAGTKTVDVVTSFFAIPGANLYEYVGSAGIDPQTKSVIQRGSLEQKFAVSLLQDVGRALVSLATKDTSTIPDKVRIQSDVISFQDVIDRYEKSHDVKLAVAKRLSTKETEAEFVEKWLKGFNPAEFRYYLQVIASKGVDNGALYSDIHNELVNPNESVWKWEKF